MDTVRSRPVVSRRAWLIGAAATVGGSLLAACSQPQPSAPAPKAEAKPTEAPKPAAPAAQPAATTAPAKPAEAAKPAAQAPAAAKEVNLRWAMWAGTQAEIDVWQELANDVTKAHPNIRVTLETVAFNDYWDKFQTQLASQTEADLVSMQAQRMPGFAVRRAMRPLQPFIDKDPELKFDDFYKVIEEGLSYNNQVYALAYDLGPHHLYYNKDLFDAAGVPVPPAEQPLTWEQFRETAAKLTKPEAGQYGFVIQPSFDAMVPWLWSGGGGYMNAEETQSTLDSPDSIAAMEFVVNMITKDKTAAPITDLANAQFASETFYSGKIGMVVNGPWNIVNVRRNGKFNWDIAPFPAGKAGSVPWVAGSGWGISNTTKFPDESWQALKVLASQTSHEKLARAGRGFPARQSALPAFKVPDQPPQNVDIVQKILNRQIGQPQPYRTTTTWQEKIVMLTRDFHPVYLGQQSVQETVAKVKPQFDELLKKHQDLLKR